MKQIMCALLSVLVIVSFTACSNQNSATSSSSVSSVSSQSVQTSDTSDNTEVDAENLTDGNYDLSFSKRDSDASYDESSAVKITLSDSSANSTDSSAVVNGGEVTIKSAGTYIISGTTKEGKIIVDAGSEDKVQIVLSGVNLTSKDSAIVVKNADKVFITLADGTENTISDASSYTETIEDTNVDAAIFSKEDLTINGSGTLNVNGNYKHGIVSKDDLVITGGIVNVTSSSTAIEGKDSVKIKSATVNVKAGSDGIRSTNTDNTAEKGFVYIHSGNITVESTNDAIQAASLLRIDGGELNLTTGGGSDNGKTHSDFGGGMRMFGSSSDTEDSESAKAVKSADTIKINGGTFNINASDDAFHSNNTVSVTDGTLNIATGDDGIHANNTLTIDGGTVNITKSYEGIEGGEITVNNGNISVASSDDGFNAAGGSDGDVQQGAFDSDASKKLIINGGYVYVNADGDGLDSNGSLEVSGGTVLISGPQNDGNGALDYGTSATITGGTLIAIGSSGMAETITGSGQCSMQTDITAQSGNTTCAVVDSNGNLIASFTPSKQYTNVVVSTPKLKTGETYSIVCGGTIEGADKNGFADSGKVSGGTSVTEIELTTENYSTGGSKMGGGQMGGRGGMGGFGGQQGGPMGGKPNGMFN